MVGGTKQALRLAEILSLPKVQVIVMRANMSCSHCRHRVSEIITKLNGLLDYMVDLRKNEVIVRGVRLDSKKRRKPLQEPPNYVFKKKFPCSLRFF